MKEWKIANHTWSEFTSDKEITFCCEVFGPKRPKQVDVYLMLKPWGCKRIPMTAEDGFYYKAQVDLSWLAKGNYEYHFGVDAGEDTLLFPAKTYCTPERWDYYEQATYAMRLVNETTPLSLLGAQDNWKHIRRTRTFRSPESQFSPVVSGTELTPAFQLSVPDLEKKDDYTAPCDVTFSHYIGGRIAWRSKSKTAPSYIRIRAYGVNNTDKAICNLVDREGRGYGAVFNLKDEVSDILIPVSELIPTKAAMLPQDWPGVNPYWYPASAQNNNGVALDWRIIDFVQISLREELYDVENQKNKGIVVEKIDLLF